MSENGRGGEVKEALLKVYSSMPLFRRVALFYLKILKFLDW